MINNLNDINSFQGSSLIQALKNGSNKDSKITLKLGDSVEISNTAKAFKKIDSFMNLGEPRSFTLNELNPEEQEEFLTMLSKLLEKGIIGYEELEVDGQKEKHFIVTQIGNDRIKGAKLYNDKLNNYTRYEDVIKPKPLNLNKSD